MSWEKIHVYISQCVQTIFQKKKSRKNMISAGLFSLTARVVIYNQGLGNCLSKSDTCTFVCLHWLKNWGFKIYPDNLQRAVCSLVQAVMAEYLVTGRVYSSQNLRPGLLFWFSWALCFLRGPLLHFSVFLFWIAPCTTIVTWDKKELTANPYQWSRSYHFLKKCMALVFFTRNCGITAETFPLLKESYSMI